jgi:hypothetical protein
VTILTLDGLERAAGQVLARLTKRLEAHG